MLTYTAKLEPQREGGYTVTVPSLPGCISEGETVNEALQNIKEAIEGYLETLVARGGELPLEFSAFRSVTVGPVRARASRRQTKAYA
jgi:predicted RNase H-like HicB family nuclease